MIRGLVQGVGFRPFIYRLAIEHGLPGEVDNRTDGVSVRVQGEPSVIDRFSNDILLKAPPASLIKSIEIKAAKLRGFDSFNIVKSSNPHTSITEISPDIAVCQECLDDLTGDPARINYPFINCTNCGPRFTIIKGIPYDRPNTTMENFAMCTTCRNDYENILNRRFHAQPVACNSCGPVYNYKDKEKTLSSFEEIIKEISFRIESGRSVTIKGLGGYFLMCDALNNEAVTELRQKKRRDSKPFAVMFRDIDAVKRFCFPDDCEEKEILSWRRPIVILRQKEPLAFSVSNGLNTTGAMLPYMPIHYLLFRELKTPAVILTSGNLSDEPIIIDDRLAEEQLLPVTGSMISYNRPIHNRADDSVIRTADKKAVLIRRSRGFVPQPVDLKLNAEGILALGAEQKNTFCIGKGNQAIMSQYIGDIKNVSTFGFFTETIDRFAELFMFHPKLIACDLHPDYFSTRHAEYLEKKFNIPLVRVQHHHAHIASCMAENGFEDEAIGVSFDGTGFGTDNCSWGSEFMVASLKEYVRYAHFDYVQLPGGERAINEPWRMAYAYLFKYFGDSVDYRSIPVFRSIEEQKFAMIRKMLDEDVNSPLTSGAGRLFDAVSALLGFCPVETFDSEAPMRLESAIDCETDEYYPFKSTDTISFSETFRKILEDLPGLKTSLISAKFHNTVAHAILQTCMSIREKTRLKKVILTGGVFQNKYLLEKSSALLRSKKFEVFTNRLVPANDGGISLGQLAIASKTK